MSDRVIIYIIVAVIVGHFLFAVGYLWWKIYGKKGNKK
jgi:hypothetical protein